MSSSAPVFQLLTRRSRSIETIAYSRAFSTTRRKRSSDSRIACCARVPSLTSSTVAIAPFARPTPSTVVDTAALTRTTLPSPRR